MLLRVVLSCSVYYITSEVCNYGLPVCRELPGDFSVIADLKVGLYTAGCAALGTADRPFALNKMIFVIDYFATFDLPLPLFCNVFIFIF